jgi:hypothetical protein
MLKYPLVTPVRPALRSQLNPRGRIRRAASGYLSEWWRVVYTEKDNGYYSGLTELDFGGNGGVVATAFSHSDLSSTQDGYAFDKNPATSWQSNFTSAKAFIGCKFPKPVSCEYVKVTASTAGYFAKSFDIEYSDDGVIWDTYWSWAPVVPLLTAGEVRGFKASSIPPANVVSNISAAAFLKHPPGGSVSYITGSVFLKHPPGGSVAYISGAAFVKRLENNISWRVIWDAVEGGNAYAAMGEVEFRSTVGGADQANGGGAISSGEYSTSTTYQTSNAFDGTNTTRWIGENDKGVGSWIGYAFPASMASFAQLSLSMKNDSAIGGPSAFRVQRYESFAAGWVTVLTRTGEAAWAAGETRTYAIV